MNIWETLGRNIKRNFGTEFADNLLSYILQFVLFSVLYYMVFKVIKNNKADKFMAIIVFFILFTGIVFVFTPVLEPEIFFVVVALIAIIVFNMFHTEIKRTLLGSGTKKHSKGEGMTVRDIEFIIDEITHAVQHMSKNDIGALIVLSNGNLPEGIISSGTIINADINAPMIEAVFYPKAPLHDGAMVIEGEKIHAAGCFLPLIQNDGLPQEVGSRHRAALGVTNVAEVTAIVVSEETGVISIAKNGEVKKKYASDADLRNVLSDYFWSDLTGKETKAK